MDGIRNAGVLSTGFDIQWLEMLLWLMMKIMIIGWKVHEWIYAINIDFIQHLSVWWSTDIVYLWINTDYVFESLNMFHTSLYSLQSGKLIIYISWLNVRDFVYIWTYTLHYVVRRYNDETGIFPFPVSSDVGEENDSNYTLIWYWLLNDCPIKLHKSIYSPEWIQMFRK